MRFRYLRTPLACLAILAPAARPACADGTLVPAASRIDCVHDFNSDILYITNGSTLVRYIVGTSTTLSPITVGGGAANLKGIDISPDRKTLAIADAVYGSSTNWVWLIDIASMNATQIAFIRGSYEGGTFSVAYGADGSLFVSSSFQGSGWVPLRRYHPDTGITEVPLTSISQDTMLCASGDRAFVGFAESNNSAGPVGRIRVSDGNIIHYSDYAAGTSWFNYEIGANRNGSQYAIPTYDGAFIYDGSMVKTGTIIGTYAADQPICAVYHPAEDLVFFPWANTTQVRCYNTNTWALMSSYNFEYTFQHPGNHAYDNGRAKLSDDGSLLAVTVANGVRVLRLYAPLSAQDQQVTVAGNSSATITVSGSVGNGGAVVYSIAAQPTHGALTGTPPNLTYTPDTGYSGGDSFTFLAQYGRASCTGTITITVTPPPADLTGLAVKPTTVAGGAVATGTVTISQATSSPVDIALASTNAAVTVPATVTVPAGSTSATFTTTTAAVSSKTSGLITATLGSTTKSVNLTVRPVSVKSVAFKLSSVVGGHSSTGTVALEAPAGPGDVTVSLDSLSPLVTITDGKNPIASIVIPAGSTTGTFAAQTQPVASITKAKVRATANGLYKDGTLTLKPIPVASIKISPTTVTGGGTSVATITLTDPAAPGDITVALSSSAPSTAWFVDGGGNAITSVVIPAGIKSVTVTVQTAAVGAKTIVSLHAAAGGVTKSTSLTVTP